MTSIFLRRRWSESTTLFPRRRISVFPWAGILYNGVTLEIWYLLGFVGNHLLISDTSVSILQEHDVLKLYAYCSAFCNVLSGNLSLLLSIFMEEMAIGIVWYTEFIPYIQIKSYTRHWRIRPSKHKRRPRNNKETHSTKPSQNKEKTLLPPTTPKTARKQQENGGKRKENTKQDSELFPKASVYSVHRVITPEY